MGETVIRHCDLCKQTAEPIWPTHDLRAVVLLYTMATTPIYGTQEHLISFKGELCQRCRTMMHEAMVRAFENIKAELEQQAKESEMLRVGLPHGTPTTETIVRRAKKPKKRGKHA